MQAIQDNPNNMTLVREDLLTYDLIKFSLEIDGLLLSTLDLNKQTYEFCLIAVKNTCYPLLYFIKSEYHTEELIELENNIDSREYIKNPKYLIDKKICKKIIKKNIEECIICKELKEYYFEYECGHLSCFDCKLKECYYNCNKIPNINIIYFNTNFKKN